MRTWFGVFAAGICCVILTASMADAATIYACKKKVGGTIRIVGAKTVCLATERKMTWPDTAEVATLKKEVAALKLLLQHFSRNGNNISITGANLWVKDGSGETNGPVNGLGNLIVGYNELRPGGGDARTGSHNIILGMRNNYTSYGGLVAGVINTVSGECSSVSGGMYNTASGSWSSVSGGYSNTASGMFSSVSGGYSNTASGDESSISGGAAISEANLYGWSGGSYHTP